VRAKGCGEEARGKPDNLHYASKATITVDCGLVFS
jgi:hypothetical protein